MYPYSRFALAPAWSISPPVAQVNEPHGLAIWTTDQGWVVENEGMPPDIEVEQTPADVIAGRDPQLEKAIQVVMAELKKNPVPAPKRPPYPVKVRKPAPPKLSASESGSPPQ